MSGRRAHQLAILRDIDALHALAVASLALLLSGGLLYVAYLVHVCRVGWHSPQQPRGHGLTLLLFGKRCRRGEPDADFRRRIGSAHRLLHGGQVERLLLLGGGPSPTEAEVAARALRAAGVPDGIELVLEHDSRDTLQNLRHARALLVAGTGDAVSGSAGTVLLSSRYHLARCALFARRLAIDHQLCAAEPRLSLAPGNVGRLCGEALYLMWIDVGTRWARLIGHRRMLAKVS